VTLDAATIRDAVAQLATDSATAEVVRAFEAEGIRAVLLKGRAIAARFYDRSLARRYGDCDLLVDPTRFDHAEAILGGLGFTDIESGWRRLERTGHASTWVRSTPAPATIDLHRTLPWCTARPADLWAALAQHTDRLKVGGHVVEVLDEARQVLVIAGHATQHREDSKTLEDLERAVGMATQESWDEAIELARRLGALNMLLTAFGRSPACEPLIARLGNLPSQPMKHPIRLVGTPALAPGLLRLSDARGQDRLRLIANKLAPSPALIRNWMTSHVADVPALAKLDGRRTPALIAGYAIRAYWLIRHAPTGIRGWRAATRQRGRT